MLHRLAEPRISALVTAVGAFPKGAKLADIVTKFPSPPPRRTMQYWLQSLAEMGRLRIRGAGRATRYFVANGYVKPSLPPANPLPAPSGVARRKIVPMSLLFSPTEAAATPAAAPARRRILPPDIPTPQQTLPPDIPQPIPAADAPVPSATGTASPYAGRRTNPHLHQAYLERLEFAIPRLIRQMVPFKSARAYFRHEAFLHFNAPDQEGFIALGLAELAALNDANRSKYRLGPAEFSYWLEKRGPNAPDSQF